MRFFRLVASFSIHLTVFHFPLKIVKMKDDTRVLFAAENNAVVRYELIMWVLRRLVID